ncbi:hypothetical protein [Micromonospora humi]|uniref:Uncharacterized protein n=1 Tax=Micromonospora humi TaxID=745366 RepID=A0A1C5JY91_9ACTN|nr:hypothetical protein [Micromonospora humi]SCG75542.1 hypothetical protein GA0070213_115135 [Micromonospora humi]
MRTKLSTMLAAVLGMTASLALVGVPAQAATAGSTATVSDRLVLEPTERGYRGSLEIDVSYQGSEPSFISYVMTEPIPVSFQNPEWGAQCNDSGQILSDGRTRVECQFAGFQLEPGERRTFTLDFAVLTPTQAYAMKARAGRIVVKVGDTVITDETFSTRFRSTTGSLANPRPYVQDAQPDLRVSAASAVTLVRQPDGRFEGRLPVTLRYVGDAPHSFVWYTVDRLPAQVGEPWTEGSGLNSVEGGALMDGEERRLTLIVNAAADAPIGELGQVDIQFSLIRAIAPDVDPTDDRITFTVTTAEAP